VIEWLPALLGYAATLAGYPVPAALPRVSFQPHSFFVEHVCQHTRSCPVLGWYDDTYTLYLDERLRDCRTAMCRGIVVHELVHYVQHVSGAYAEGCDPRRENEAYAVQGAYLSEQATGYHPMMRVPTICRKPLPGWQP
jgi:hypothetical protein